MKAEDRAILVNELAEINQRMKGDFINPIDYRRSLELESLLMSDGATKEIRLVAGPPRESHRVTNFSRNRN